MRDGTALRVLRRREGQLDGEARPFADSAGDRDLAADRLDEVLDDREPEPRTAELPAPRLVDAVEAFEDAREVVAGDPDPRVGDLDGNRLVDDPAREPDRA